MKLHNIYIPIRTWYYSYIKYRKFNNVHRSFLVAFEQGIHARKSNDTLVYSMLRVNIERAKRLLTDKLEGMDSVEQVIGELGKEWKDGIKELEMLDGQLWRNMFTYYVRTHPKDEDVAKVWSCPIEDVVKWRMMDAKKK